MEQMACLGRTVLLSLLCLLVPFGGEGALAQEKIVEHGPYIGKLARREVVAHFTSNA